MNLAGFRAAVAQTLGTVAHVADGTWALLPAPVDAVEPPAYVLVWGPDPMLAIQTVCTDQAQLEVVAIAARLEPQANYPVLEDMVDAAIAALTPAGLRPWQSLAPAPFQIAQLDYLASRIQIRQPVTS